jgi:hypothetical protein
MHCDECDGPAVLVRVGTDFAVPNGNHRLYKVAYQQDTEHPLYAVFFDSPESHGIFMDSEPVDFHHRSFRVPPVTSKPRAHSR